MSDLMELRLAAHEIFGEALRAIEPVTAIMDNVRLEDSRLIVCDTELELSPFVNVFGISIGKASERMSYAVGKIFGKKFLTGVLSGPSRGGGGWDYFDGGHPLPNEASLDAAKGAIHLLEGADHENSLIVFLISGGGSAMFELPIHEDITLADLRAANEILVGCGASISEVNAVRRGFSAVKGGRLATFAPKSRQLTLIISDVPKGEEHNVASGPTWSPPAHAPSAVDVVARYKLGDRLPASIMRAIENAASPLHELQGDRHKHFVLLDNDTALEAAANAARARGFVTEIARDIVDALIDVGCEELLKRLSNLQSQNPDSEVCLISGGEFACPIRGDGVGGRNSETALRLAMAVDKDRERYKEFVALCVGTDGIDGSSLAAGAIVDGTTMERARSMFLEPTHFLDNSASGALFVALEDAIETGPTGTNVRDLRILLSAPDE
jgi:hydroxypyruvate reductase